MAKKWSELERRMSPASRARVDAAVKEALASMPLAEIRKAVGLTQQEIARNLEMGQGSVSKIERSADMYLSTLRKFVESMGGELRLVASFPGGREIQIDGVEDIGQSGAAA